MKPTAYPLKVDRVDIWKIYDQFEMSGHRFAIVGIDAATSTLFVTPVGKRSVRRAAVRAIFG